jgi:hypothetical protein
MSHLHIDANQKLAAKLTDLPGGTLLMAPTETASGSGPFWGLRFNSENENGEVRSVIWLNGMPWHGPDPSFYGMPIDGTGWESMNGIALGPAHIEIDVTSGAGRLAREIRWDQAAGYIAVGARGTFLLGEKSKRESVWGAHYAIDIASWSEVVDAYRDAPVEWFSRWNVVIETKRGTVVMPFEARTKAAARGA